MVIFTPNNIFKQVTGKKFTYHIIQLRVYNSIFSNKATKLYNHHHNLTSEDFVSFIRSPVPTDCQYTFSLQPPTQQTLIYSVFL